ncbi:LPS export ABC transporter permease LptG [Kangiella shandongensis]|uniref:LPS export ABC transporter permease LptG n=1 Tax=Kangiella shandongensis TaxID=2763258 RepID=UPI001CBEEE2A|nr:LPS export ABC transporter permease LptG [Kangiella shandongensis]
MNILRFYIGKTILATSIITLVTLAIIRVLFALIDESGDFDKGSYAFMDGLSYALLLSPQYIYEFFPMAILIGSIAGLGILASHSELTVMRAAGKTTWQIIGAALSYGLLLIAFSVFLGEYVAPKTTLMAENIRNRALYGEQFVDSNQGLWLKDGAHMVHVGEVMGSSQLSDVTVYEFNRANELTRLIHADTARLNDAVWTLQNGDVTQLGVEVETNSDEESRLGTNVVSRIPFSNQQWETSINLDNLSALRVEPENMNIVNLYQYRQYLAGNGLDTKSYDLAFWQKVFQPISTAVMIILAASFIFGPMRSVSMGARVLVGVLTGMVYFFAVRSFGPVSLVAGVPAFLGAMMPPLIFAVAAWYLLKKAG